MERTFLQSPQGNDLLQLYVLVKLDRKRSINFSHSSQKAWRILNSPSGKSQHSPRQCSVSVDAILPQLVEMGDSRLLVASHLRLFFKKCLIFRGPQHQTQ